jgi:tRNA (adenine57-N1/adenine58-N1)-methyltransferase
MERTGYDEVVASEVLVRTWHVTARSVRPDHRMVGHTGFVITGRRGPSPAPTTAYDEEGEEEAREAADEGVSSAGSRMFEEESDGPPGAGRYIPRAGQTE